MNIEKILNEGINILKKNDISNPQLDSEILLSNLIKRDKKHIILNSKEILNNKQLENFNDFIERRKNGEPIAYLINKKEFWKDEFYVNEDVLIPRPDTELIIEQVLKIYSKQSQLQVLDIGTGSGCILLSILKERPNFYGTGIDISKGMLEVGHKKIIKHGLDHRINLQLADSENLPFNDNSFDALTAGFGVRNFQDLDKGLSEMNRTLKSGGIVATYLVYSYSLYDAPSSFHYINSANG